MLFMSFYSRETVADVKKIDLLTYLQNYEPEELVHVSGNVYCTKAHDSLRISNGKWCWFSQGIGGKSALDYLIKVNGYTFLQAMEILIDHVKTQKPVLVSYSKQEPKPFCLPKAYRYATYAVSYLECRGISSEIVDFCFHTGRIYESYPHHNVVFVGFDKNGKERFACQRGIATDFKGDVAGSNKKYSFAFPVNPESKRVHLFESAIDLMSYATLLQMEGMNWRRANLLSLSGIYQPKKEIAESKLPAALTQYLEDYPHINSVMLHMDNDKPGRLAAKTICTVMPEGITVINRPPPHGKDYNDYLCARLKKSIQKNQERAER